MSRADAVASASPATAADTAEVGVFGGSGFYSFLDDVRHVTVETPYGEPSAPIALASVEGRRVAFLPRHGLGHEVPAHRVNYRANVWAMRALGVRRVLGPCAAGSLRRDIPPGDVIVLDQLVDRTRGRADTFHDGPETVHTAFADPYCPELRQVAVRAAAAEGITVHDGGTVVVVQGPRFSTRAESEWFRSAGWHAVNMTQHPEAFLCREAGLCYAGLALITDFDSGVESEGIEPVTMDEVLRVLAENVERSRALLLRAIPAIPAEPSCACGQGSSLDGG